MRKLATASFSFAAAILISRYFAPNDRLPIFCAIAALASLAGLAFHGRRRLRLFLAFLALSAGFLWSWAYAGIFVEPAAKLDGQGAAVTAIVTGYPSDTLRGRRVDVRIRQDGLPSIGARLYFSRGEVPAPGGIVEFSAQFSRTDGLGDSERIDALSSRGAFLAAYASGEVRASGEASGLPYFPRRLARSVADMIDVIFPDDVSPFMQALLTGERDRLNGDSALMAALSASGISHVVAISGMHVAFLMGFLGALIKNKRLFSALSLPVLLIFMAMTGFSPSVTRAGIMQAFLICAPIFRRESDTVTSLSAALLVLLAANPFSIASAGLQLSFAATFGIVLFAGRIDSAISGFLRLTWVYQNKPLRSASRFVSASFSTTVGALVFTIPLTAYHFGHVSLAAPLTNLLALWAVSIIFPLGIAACILGFVFTPLASAAAFPITIGVRYVVGVARLLAAVPHSSIYASNSPVLFWLAYVYLMYTILPALRARARQYLRSAFLAAISLCLVVFLNPLFTPGMGGPSVAVLDVGQGQSVAILSKEHTAIVDCGAGAGISGGAAAHDFLASRGRTSIELLVITHFHSDHINGVEYLLSRIGVGALLIPDPEGSEGSHEAESIITLASRRGADIIYVTEPLRVSLGENTLMVYPPLGSGNENERGLSVLSYGEDGGLLALITGDMASATERSLLRYADLPAVDLLVVGHHGSRHSTSEELLAAVRPTLGVISVGRNSYGHPTPDTLARLEEYYVTAFRTDIMGDVIVVRG